MSNAAIMLCAGRAARMRGTVSDKVLAPLAGRPALIYSITALLDSGVADYFVFVVRDAEQMQAVTAVLAKLKMPLNQVVFTVGGAERQDSVFHGLQNTPPQIKNVFIHDCARPLITPASLRALATAVETDGAAVLAHRVTDTIKQIPLPAAKNLSRLKLRDLQRETLWAMETPQAFARDLITRAYAKVRAQKLRVTDDVAAAALLGQATTIVENPSPNPKLTHPEDFAWVELLLKKNS
ncbi:MAG TPA: IspD/TarI family cytidylyltransferase [Opitutales bacterium]|jgi:2-C-methyl-D-erythritol 4-phosphate cytidylyltransferase|nr:IspD/TarI family cytidylyltransferase [Opitutales bacterium]